MIIGRDLISELKVVLDFDTQCISWDGTDQPMKSQGGATKRNYSLRGSLLQDDNDATREPQHVHAAHKHQFHILDANYKASILSEIIECISTIDDIEKNNLLGLLIDVLSTYLPLLLTILNLTYQELTNQEKQLMLFDALPKDYIDQMKKANQVPLEVPLEELRSYALYIEKTKVNQVKKSHSTETKDSSNNNNHPPLKKVEKGMVKGNSRKGRKMVKDIIHLQLLMDKTSLFVPFVETLAMLKTPAEPKKE
jgi:hypothetical protein